MLPSVGSQRVDTTWQLNNSNTNGLKNTVLREKGREQNGFKAEHHYVNEKCIQFRETITTKRVVSLRSYDSKYHVGSGRGSWRTKREKIKNQGTLNREGI